MMNDDFLNWESMKADYEIWDEYEHEIEGAVEMLAIDCEEALEAEDDHAQAKSDVALDGNVEHAGFERNADVVDMAGARRSWGPSRSSQAAKPINADAFSAVFAHACKGAWEDVLADDVLKVKNSKHGAEILLLAAEVSKLSDEICCLPIADCMRSAFVGKAFVSFAERQTLMRDVNRIRISPGVTSTFKALIQRNIPSSSDLLCGWLMQIWFRNLVARMLNALHLLRSPCDKRDGLPEPLTEADQNVLYYISGFIVMKLVSFMQRRPKLAECSNLISRLATSEPQKAGHFVEKFASWVHKQSRGGLKYPIPEFYLLIRELDLIFRQVALTKGLATLSLNKMDMVKAMNSSAMVHYYWNRINAAADTNDCKSKPVLQFVICLFVSVKGIAVARKEKDRLTAAVNKKRPAARSASLRGQLRKR